MSFAQQSGPPASAKQIAELLSLLEANDFDFSTARHRYGLNQRQARGKFTAPEATELIERLTNEAEGNDPGAQARFDDPGAVRAQARTDDAAAARTKARGETQLNAVLRDIPAEVLADELQRRGWAVIPPS